MTDQSVGGKRFKDETLRIRRSANIANEALYKLMEGTPGPQTTAALVAQLAVQLGIIIDAAANLQSIGREEKRNRSKKSSSELST